MVENGNAHHFFDDPIIKIEVDRPTKFSKKRDFRDFNSICFRKNLKVLWSKMFSSAFLELVMRSRMQKELDDFVNKKLEGKQNTENSQKGNYGT